MRKTRSSLGWLPWLAVLLVALGSGCAKGSSYPGAAAPARFDGFDRESEVSEEAGYGVSTAGDVDADTVADTEDLPMAEPAEAGPPPPASPEEGGGFRPAPAPPADTRLAQGRPGGDERASGVASGTASTTPLAGTQPPEPLADVPQPKPGIEAPAAGGEAKLAGPLLIYDATVYMAVFEVAKALDAAQKLVTELGGYLVRRDERNITMRVPAAKYREALEGMGKLGDVLHREETVQDVTDEFFDLQVRLKNAHAMRARLEQLLAQAKNVEEALMVERELGRVTEQIERLEGRLKLLRELVAFSTITVQFKPRPVDTIDATVRLPFQWLNQLGLSQLLSL